MRAEADRFAANIRPIIEDVRKAGAVSLQQIAGKAQGLRLVLKLGDQDGESRKDRALACRSSAPILRRAKRRFVSSESGASNHHREETSTMAFDTIDHPLARSEATPLIQPTAKRKTVGKIIEFPTVRRSGARQAAAPRPLAQTSPTTEKPTVRKYLTSAELERLIKAVKQGRYGQRDALAVLLAFRHGLRVSELCGLAWAQVDSRPRG